MIGTVLDKYEVLQKVGEGGMATVYRGRHTTLNREVAVKILHPHLSSSTRNRKRFAREARAIEQLRHENILEIFDYSGSSAEECYIVTEFVGGETLTTWIDSVGHMPSEVVSLIGIRLADALAYAHKEGVLHRDLKPDNVMIRFDGAVKLMDFGIARFLDESQVTMTGALVGSPAFMSPEQAKEGKLDARSDLFSLGTVLFYLATGHFPFHGSNPSLVLRNIIEGNRPHITDLQPGLSATLVDTIERLLQIDPNDRQNTAQDVAIALRQSLEEVGDFLTHPRWSIAEYLKDPDAYEAHLYDTLPELLLSRGKEHMDAGQHLACLRLFNRLLTMDEDNEEVLTLVRGLDTGSKKSPMAGVIGIVVSVTLIVGGLLWYWNRELEPPTPLILVEPALTSEPLAPASEVSTDDTITPPMGELIDSPSATPAPVKPSQPKPQRTNPRPLVAVKADLPDAPLVPISDERPEVETGKLELRVINGWGYIYVDSVPTDRNTRDSEPLELPAGGHDIEIRSDFIKTYRLTVHVAPGETRRYDEIEVEYRPIKVLFDPRFDDDCAALLNGVRAGTLSELNHSLSVPRQLNTSSIIAVLCGDQVHQMKVNDATPEESHFPLPQGSAP